MFYMWEVRKFVWFLVSVGMVWLIRKVLISIMMVMMSYLVLSVVLLKMWLLNWLVDVWLVCFVGLGFFRMGGVMVVMLGFLVGLCYLM